MEKSQVISSRLETLHQILENLPDGLPKPDLTQYPFHSVEIFIIDREEVEYKGEVGALTRLLGVMFGFQTRSQGDSIIPLLERGPTICAVVEVLCRFLDKFTGDAILEKWVDDLSAAG